MKAEAHRWRATASRTGWVALLVSTVMLLLPALINGFPLVYSDTGTYLISALEGMVPIDRPYWYGGFLRLTGVASTWPWGGVLLQCLLCATYLLRTIARFVPQPRLLRAVLGITALLVGGSGLAWYAGQWMPDVFTALGILAIYHLLVGSGGRPGLLLDLAVVALACWTHLSNLMILPVVGLVLLLLGYRKQLVLRARAWVFLLVACAVGWGGLALANRALTGEAYLSRGGHVFLVGRMLEADMLVPLLEKYCPEEQFRLCAYKDSLPATAAAFLWWGDSPVAKEGGWEGTKLEYDRITALSLRDPHFLWMHLRSSVLAGLRQMTVWRISGDLESQWYRTEDAAPTYAIRTHAPQHLAAFHGAMQNGGRGELHMAWPDRIYRAVLLIALLSACVIMFRRAQDARQREARALVIFALVSIVLAGWICATLSTVDARYLGRTSWLLVCAVTLWYVGALRAHKVA